VTRGSGTPSSPPTCSGGRVGMGVGVAVGVRVGVAVGAGVALGAGVLLSGGGTAAVGTATGVQAERMRNAMASKATNVIQRISNYGFPSAYFLSILRTAK